MTAPMNPDCAGGKHVACAGDAWDFDTDQPAPCSCTCHTGRGRDELALTRYATSPLNVDRRDVDVETARDELAWLAGEQS